MSLNKDQIVKAHELYADRVHQVAAFHPYAGRISELSETAFGPANDIHSEQLTFSGLTGPETPFDIATHGPDEVMNSYAEPSFNNKRLASDVGLPLFMDSRMGMSDNVYEHESTCTTKQVAYGGIVNMEVSGRMAKPRWVHAGLRFRLTGRGKKLVLEYSSGVQMNFRLIDGNGINFEGSGVVPQVALGTDIHLITSASVCGVPNFQGFYGVQNFFMNNTIKLVKKVRFALPDEVPTPMSVAIFRPAPTVDMTPLADVVGIAFDDEVGTKIWLSEKLPVVCKWEDARRLVSGCTALADSDLPEASCDKKYEVYRWGEVKEYNGCDKGTPYFRGYNQLVRKGVIERMNELDDSEFVDFD